MNPSTLALRLSCTVLAGLLLGADREDRGQTAGMRTTLLVCCAASISMLQMDVLMSTPDTHNSIVRLDLMRLPLGILTGMGFIGGGAIVRKGSLVHGLTTAATLWIATVVGLCFGGGQIVVGAAGTVVALIVLRGLKRIESVFFRKHRGVLTLELATEHADEGALFERLRQAGFHVRSRQIERRADEPETWIRLEGTYVGDYPAASIRLVRSASQIEGVARVDWSDDD